jgi:autotransporter-associated beta strand protein
MPGGTLDIRGQNLGTRAITISGSGDQGIGALINNGGSQQNAVINLNLAADASVGGTGRWDVRGTGANINGGTFTLTKVGGNQVSVVAPTSVSLGNINVNAGTLSFENGNNIMGSTSFAATVNVGGTLQFWNNLGGVTQNKPIVLNGGIVTSENNATTLTGPISLAGPATGELRANNALTITNVISGSGGFTKSGGDVLVLSNNNTYTGPTIVSSGTLRVTGSIAKSAVTVNGGTFEVPAVQKVAGLTVNAGGLTNVNNTATPYALTVGDGTSAASPFGVPASGTNFGKVQLNNNGMIVDVAAGGEAAAATSVRQAVLAAYNGGAWTGNGLTSAQITGANGLALGFGTPTEVAAAVTGGQFLGSPADASSIVVKATIAGDANLDKSVNFGDLLVLAKNYNTPSGSYWAKGDFNYDGAVNFGDLLILAKHYNQAMPTEPIPGASAAFEADMAAAFAAVPEPGTLSLLGIGAAAMLGRRQRRVRKS